MHWLKRPSKLAWLTLSISLALTIFSWHTLRQQAIQNAEILFKSQVNEVIAAISRRLHQHEQILLGAAGLFEASQSVERGEWRAYINRLNLKYNYPGIQGVGYSQMLRPEELDTHIEETRAQGFPSFTVHPAGTREQYSSIIYLEPFQDRNLAAFGYDMFSEPTRRAAMQQAGESGETSISGKVTLVQETHGKTQAGFLMYLPIYKKNAPLTNSTERWSALEGFVYSPYRMDDLMTGILGDNLELPDFRIYDAKDTIPDQIIYHLRELSTPHLNPQFTAQQLLNAYGRQWTISLNSTAEFEAKQHNQAASLLLVSGFLISCLLFSLAAFLSYRREEAEQIALRITEDIRKNQEVMRQNEIRMQAILNGAEHLIITTDTKGMIQSINRSTEEHLGYRADELVHLYTPAIFHNVDEIVHRANELKEEGLPIQLGFEVFVHKARTNISGETREWTYVRKDGSHFPVSLTVTALRDPQGEINAFLGIATDISERVNAARVKHEDDLRMSIILDHVLDGVLTVNNQGIIESFNCAAERIFGYDSGSIIGQNIELILPINETDKPAPFSIFLNNHGTKLVDTRNEVIGKRKNGDLFPMDLGVSEMVLNKKQIFTAVIRDLSERKRFDEELRKLYRAVEQSPVSVMMINTQHRVEYVNSKFTELTGFSREETIGKPPRFDISGFTPKSVSAEIWQTVAKGKEWRGQLKNKRKNGELYWEELYISPVTDHTGHIINFVAIKEDITKQIEVDRMKSEFISTVSHELRTPLTSIRGSLGLLSGGAIGELPAAIKPMIDIANKNAERLIILVNDLLDMEKIEAGKMDFRFNITQLAPLLKQAIEQNKNFAQQYQITYQLLEPVPNVMLNTDEQRFMQVLTNLLSNAAKFSPELTTVTMEASCHDNIIKITVHNQGLGIPESLKNRIFQKFVQADASDTRAKGGTGLGLAISKAIIEQMGGTIDFTSIPGEKTSFFITLPIDEQ